MGLAFFMFFYITIGIAILGSIMFSIFRKLRQITSSSGLKILFFFLKWIGFLIAILGIGSTIYVSLTLIGIWNYWPY